MKRFALSSVFFLLILGCCIAYSKVPDILPRNAPHFAFDILSFKSPGPSSDSVRVDVYLAVPYQALEFQYAVDKYVADYGAIVQITDRVNGQVIFDRYQAYNVLESVALHEQRIEAGQERADAEQFSVKLAAGHAYEFHLMIRDLSSHHEYDTVVHCTTKDFRTSYTSMSDLMVYRSKRGQHIVPSIGSDVGMISGNESGVFAELYNAPADSTVYVVSEVFAIKSDHTTSEEDVASHVVSITHTPASHDAGQTAPSSISEVPIFSSGIFDDLWIGRYKLQTYILSSAQDTNLRLPNELRKRAIAWSEKIITVSTEHGIPISESDLTQAIDQLRLIAIGSEWDSLNAANTVAQKRDAVLNFWRGRNYNGAGGYNRPMQIFYARVQYANDHFGGGFSQGWRSDRGRVYIALGPPEYIDSHPYEATQKPYEIWEYPSLHFRYYFVDRYMLGDYRLVGAPPPLGTFIWDK